MAGPFMPFAESVTELAGEVSVNRDADVYFFAGGVNTVTANQFILSVLTNRRRPNAAVILTTPGGSGDAAYRMARTLQSNYAGGRVTILLPSFCKSAGTLLVVGASDIVMSDLAELGPLDIQITKEDTLGERTSGLTPSQSLATLREGAFECFEKFVLDIQGNRSHPGGFALTCAGDGGHPRT